MLPLIQQLPFSVLSHSIDYDNSTFILANKIGDDKNSSEKELKTTVFCDQGKLFATTELSNLTLMSIGDDVMRKFSGSIKATFVFSNTGVYLTEINCSNKILGEMFLQNKKVKVSEEWIDKLEEEERVQRQRDLLNAMINRDTLCSVFKKRLNSNFDFIISNGLVVVIEQYLENIQKEEVCVRQEKNNVYPSQILIAQLALQEKERSLKDKINGLDSWLNGKISAERKLLNVLLIKS